jgi:DNA-binding response OmpR family regulator
LHAIDAMTLDSRMGSDGRRSDTTAGAGNVNVPQLRKAPFAVGPVYITPKELLVVADGAKLWVRPLDMDVLVFLATNAGRVLSRVAIFEAIWQRPLDPHDRSVDVAVRRLRVGLGNTAPGWDFIHTHHRRGYRFEPVVRSKRRGRSGSR